MRLPGLRFDAGAPLMPLYTFRCVDGHVNDLVRPIGTEQVECPRCSLQAWRSRVNRIAIGKPEVDSRGLYRRFTEATAEIDHAATKIEQSTGTEVQTPSLWKRAKAKVAAMDAAGETKTAWTS